MINLGQGFCLLTSPGLLIHLTCAQDRAISTAMNCTSFCSEDDKIILEDEGARMPLAGEALPVQELVTGS